jgi:hypothetical protein
MDDTAAVDPAAEDWFTADYLEFAGSLAGQSVTELTEDGLEGTFPGLGKASDSLETAVYREQ